MSGRVLKWSVPVDDRPHLIGMGEVVHVACQHSADSVEVWTLYDQDSPPSRRSPVQVFGTGQPVPSGWHHRGSALTAGGALVWHVFEAPLSQWTSIEATP